MWDALIASARGWEPRTPSAVGRSALHLLEPPHRAMYRAAAVLRPRWAGLPVPPRQWNHIPQRSAGGWSRVPIAPQHDVALPAGDLELIRIIFERFLACPVLLIVQRFAWC